MTRSLLTLALVALTACGSPLAQPGGPVTIIDYVDTVRVGNVRYLVARPSGPALTAADLGDEVTRVRFQIAGSDKGPDYLIQDGDATMLPVGTPLHTVKGYRPGFRLAAQLAAGGIRLYECDDNLEAKTGADLLDVAGKTTASPSTVRPTAPRPLAASPTRPSPPAWRRPWRLLRSRLASSRPAPATSLSFNCRTAPRSAGSTGPRRACSGAASRRRRSSAAPWPPPSSLRDSTRPYGHSAGPWPPGRSGSAAPRSGRPRPGRRPAATAPRRGRRPPPR